MASTSHELRPAFPSLMRMVVLVMAAIVGLTVSQATPAIATTSQQGALSYEAALDQSLNVIEEARLADPAGFDQKVDVITSSTETMQLLGSMSYRDMTADLQAELFAATADSEVIQGLVYGSEKGYITAVDDGGTRSLTIDGPSPSAQKGDASTSAVAFPQCPSAWAAFTAWFVTTYPYCAAVTTLGFWWGLACAGLTSLGSSVIDFNGGC